MESIDERSPIVSKEQLNKRGYEFAIKNGFLAVQIYKNNEDATKVTSNATILEEKKWYHVAMTYAYVADGSSVLKMYLDGEEEFGLNTAVGPQTNNTADVRVGAYIWSDTYSRFFNGKIDELYVFKKVLNQEEIKALGKKDTTLTEKIILDGRFEYMKVYPNPSHNITTLEINLSEYGQILVNLIDIQGHIVKEVCNKELPAGSHTFNIHLHDLEPGVYFAVLTSSLFKKIDKIVVISNQ